MLWIYDDAIVDDLKGCIDPDGSLNRTVKTMGETGIMGVFAQAQDDKITFPAIFIQRNDETPLDSKLFNYTKAHKGVPAVYESKENNIYFEKSYPIDLKYELHALATNTADLDEIIREILFRYSSMYYLTAHVPYESKRNIRFGVAIVPNTNIRKSSGVTEYIEGGKLYEARLELYCQGAVLLHYTPRHVQGIVMEKGIQVH